LKLYFLTGFVILRETGREVYGIETGISKEGHSYFVVIGTEAVFKEKHGVRE
jgi:hypothetical protein